ncbi:hypothetical protein HBI45_147850 [Parastagonospora nodorum]|nr:hypothetical protein HBI45_147850 [Parastagonospora nodorum]
MDCRSERACRPTMWLSITLAMDTEYLKASGSSSPLASAPSIGLATLPAPRYTPCRRVELVHDALACLILIPSLSPPSARTTSVELGIIVFRNFGFAASLGHDFVIV